MSSDESVASHTPCFISQVMVSVDGQIGIVEGEIALALRSCRDPDSKALLESLAKNIHDIKVISAKVSSEVNTEGLGQALSSAPSSQKVAKLTEAVSELQKEITDSTQYGYYRMVADLLTEVKEQLVFFQPFLSVPVVTELKEKISDIETELKRQLQWALREIGQLVEGDVPENVQDGDASSSGSISPALSAHLQAISDMHLVVDALGDSCRMDLLERFSQLQLIPYERKFVPGKRFADIDSLDQRWSWFRRLAKAVDDRLSSVFPASWNIQYHIFIEFCRRTKKHLHQQLTLLEEKNLEQTVYVQTVIKALKATLVFETEIKSKLSRDVAFNSSEEVLLKETIGDAFDPFLDPYIKMVRQELDELVQSMLLEEENTAADDQSRPMDPFDSSRKMFEYVKTALEKCSKFSNGQTLISLSLEFRTCLQQYAESLGFRLPNPTPNPKAGKPPYYIIPDGADVTFCRIVTTGEYCAEVIPQLEELMKDMVRPSLREEVEFTSQVDTFLDLCSRTVAMIVIGVINRLEEPFKAMRRINWGGVETLGDCSEYVGLLNSELEQMIPVYRGILSPTYCRNFCSKLAIELLEKFLGYIKRQKKISPVGAEQLLVDCESMETLANNICVIGVDPTSDPAGSRVPQSHAVLVGALISKIETILKLIRTDDDALEETFRLIWPDGRPEDLKFIREIKAGRHNPILPVSASQALSHVKGAVDKVGEVTGASQALSHVKGAVDKVGEVTGAKAVTSSVSSTAKAGVDGLKSFGNATKTVLGDFASSILSGNLLDSKPRPTSKPGSSANKPK